MWTAEYVDSVLDSFEKGDVLILQNEINGIEDILEKAYARGISIVLNPSPFEACILSWQLEKVSLFFINEVEGESDDPKKRAKRHSGSDAVSVSECCSCTDPRRKRCMVCKTGKNGISARHRKYRQLTPRRREIPLPDIF